MPKPDPLLWRLVLQLILILINAFFAAAEIALISINGAKMERLAAQGNRRAERLLALTRQPARFLGTIQVGITLAGFLGSAFAADNFSQKLAYRFIELGVPLSASTLRVISLVVITIIFSFFTLVLGELVPKRIAMRKAEPLAFALAGCIGAIAWVFSPVVWLLTHSTNALLRLLRIDPYAQNAAITEEEICLMVDAGSERGTIAAGEQEIIHNVFEFDRKSASEVMTHRIDVVILRLGDGDEQWERTIVETRHSYYPVCGDTADDITGLLSAKDYLRLKDRCRKTVLEEAIRQAVFVPESVKIDVLFRRMKQLRNHVAVVLDEYGGMSGIITMNDLLEQLVGNLDDDDTILPAPPEIEALDTRRWRISGAASLDRVAKTLGRTLPLSKYDTFGGFVFSLLGHIPEDGQTAELEGYGLRIQLTEIREHRLERATVELTDPGDSVL